MAFQLRAIPVQNRPLTDAAGQPLIDPHGNPIGVAAPNAPAVLHWYDGPKGQGWLTESRRQIAIAVGRGDGPTRARALGASAAAVMLVYDCYNVPWYNDPAARSLYRERIAGPPGPPGNEAGEQWGILRTDNYNRAVNSRETSVRDFVGGPMYTEFPLARVMNALQSGVGRLPLAARAAFDRQFPNRDTNALPRFFESLRFFVQPIPAPTDENGFPAFTDADVMAARSIRNAVRVQLGSDVSHGNLFCRRASGVDCTQSGSVFDRDAYWFDDGANLAASFGDWTTYLADWIARLEGRTAEQTILDARAYCVYQNEEIYSVVGRSNFIPALTAEIQRLESPSPDPSVRIIGTAAVALGAALASVTYGISAIIGGAIGGATALAAAAAPPDVSRLPVDDLRRTKPLFEHGWLAGDPSGINIETGVVDPTKSPEQNGLTVPDPPGWNAASHVSRPALPTDLLHAAQLGRYARRQEQVRDHQVHGASEAGGSDAGAVLIGTAAVVGGAALAWKAGLLDKLL